MLITKERLIQILKKVKGCQFVSLDTITEPKLVGGKSSPLNGLLKKSTTNGLVGFIYENSVNNQRQREGLEKDFESTSRKWGNRIFGTPLIEHNGKFYLEVKPNEQKSEYHLGKNIISKEEVEKYLYKSNNSRQGVENIVKVCDYSIDKIRKIRINNEEYEVV